MNDEMKELLERVHSNITSIEYGGNEIPCIVLEEKKFNEIIKNVAGKPLSVFTNLNILHNGLGNVFVEIVLTFSNVSMQEKILIYANESIRFFELLKDTSILAISSPNFSMGNNNVFMIQLPNPYKINDALEIIRQGLKSKR